MKHIKERLNLEVAIDYVPYYSNIFKKRILHQTKYIKPLKKVLYLFALALSFTIPEEDYSEYHITPCDFTAEEMDRVQHIVDIDYERENETKGHSELDIAWKQAIRELSSMCESTKLNYSKILCS